MRFVSLQSSAKPRRLEPLGGCAPPLSPSSMQWQHLASLLSSTWQSFTQANMQSCITLATVPHYLRSGQPASKGRFPTPSMQPASQKPSKYSTTVPFIFNMPSEIGQNIPVRAAREYMLNTPPERTQTGVQAQPGSAQLKIDMNRHRCHT